MLPLFQGVIPYIKPKPRGPGLPKVDNVVFRLHYKVTFAALIVASILVSSYSFIDTAGSAIQCMMDKNVAVPAEVINRFCWISSTYTLPKHFVGQPGKDFPFYGVGHHTDNDERVYHAYYQWVPLFLVAQAIAFYAPHWLWKVMENGRIKHIVVGLSKGGALSDEKDPALQPVVDYMTFRILQFKSEHRRWAFSLMGCEALNLANVLLQMYVTNKFLGGEFSTYGTQVLEFVGMDPEVRVDPMARVFPRMTKCTFNKYGGSGTIQRLDALCVLGMNILNEKIFIFLWFWFIILAVITGANLAVRAVEFAFPPVRNRLVQLENLGQSSDLIQKSDLEAVVSMVSYPDWLIIYYLAQSMTADNFATFVSALAMRLREELHDRSANESPRPPPAFEDHDPDEASRRSTMKSPASLFTSLINRNGPQSR